MHGNLRGLVLVSSTGVYKLRPAGQFRPANVIINFVDVLDFGAV
jgi:hypothetical protein